MMGRWTEHRGVCLRVFALATASIPGAALAQDGTPLASGELEGTAQVLEEGQSQISLGTTYSRGVTEDLQLGTSIIGWLAGANVFGELQVLEQDSSALSVSGSVYYLWRGAAGVSVVPTYTLGAAGEDRVNLSAGVSYVSSGGIGVPVNVSYDLVTSPQTTFRFRGQTDLGAAVAGSPGFLVGANWNHGWDHYRLALGLDVTRGGVDATTEEAAALVNLDTSDLPPILPLPYIRMWWVW